MDCGNPVLDSLAEQLPGAEHRHLINTAADDTGSV
jgi:hypothetical protein